MTDTAVLLRLFAIARVQSVPNKITYHKNGSHFHIYFISFCTSIFFYYFGLLFIQPNGAIVAKSSYTALELELTQQPVELNGCSAREDLIRF
jgi:hypothetical protein